MGVPPSGFPLYISGGKYNVSLSFPGVPPLDKVSDISKSIEGKSPALLLVPNVEFIQKVIEGDIGIGDSILKGAFTKNFASPITTGNEFVFKKLAELTKIDVSNIEKYRKPPQTPSPPSSNPTDAVAGAAGAAGSVTGAANTAAGAAGSVTGAANALKSKSKFNLPASEVKVSSEFDMAGLKALEKTLLKSIFETQKPYMEIAKLVVANLAKAEDIVARILPLALPLGTPLNTKSAKPVGNGGSGSRPKALGFGGGAEVKKAIARLDALSKKGGETMVSPNGEALRGSNSTPGNAPLTGSQSAGQENFSNNDSPQSPIPPDGYEYRVVSKIFSTGEFDPNIEYQYTYINLPPDEDPGENDQGLNLNDDGDPYKGFKPDCIIFGIFDSKGAPLNPLTPLTGYDSSGAIVQTSFAKAQWIVDSPKWKFNPGTITWPSYGEPNFYFDQGPAKRTTVAKKAPDAGTGQPPYVLSKYEEGQKNLLNKEDAIPGDPVIASFDSVEVSEYQSFFNDLIEFRLATAKGITEEDKVETRSAVYPQLNVSSHLENVFLYGQSKSSYYIPLQVAGLSSKDNPFPALIRKSLKPFKIYSANAAADSNLRKAFGTAMDNTNGNVWVDPESDYAAKVIRVDPTTQITYYKPGSTEPTIATIKSFIKNVTQIQISDNRTFNIEVQKNTTTNTFFLFDSQTNVTTYYLENWNFNDNDGLIAQDLALTNANTPNQTVQSYGLVNNQPTKNDNNAYKIKIWGDRNTPYYDTVSGLLTWTVGPTGSQKNIDLEKQPDGTWNYTKYTGSGSNKVITPTTGYVRLEKDDSIVEVQNGKITKWFYMTPDDITFEDGTTGGYGNGELKKTSTPSVIQNSNINSTNGTYTSCPLPPDGYKRLLTINLGSSTSGLWTQGGNVSKKRPIQNVQDTVISNFQIRVATPDNPNGAIIDPSRIFNEQLKTSKPFINTPGTKYGHGTPESPQEIGVIKRFMLTEFDTESYYIVEGVLPSIADELLSGLTQSDSGGAGAGAGGAGGAGGGGDYKLPDAIGAIKVFISFLVDIFSKLIPAIKKLLKLLKDPLGFITDIVAEKLGENFSFLSPQAFDTFKSAANVAKSGASSGGSGASVISGAANSGEAPSVPSGSNAGSQAPSVTDQSNVAANAAPGQANNLNTSASGSVPGVPNRDAEKKSKLVKKVKNKIKASKLNGVVFVDDRPKLRSVLDGVGTIPFEMFGKDLSFGMELNMSKLPEGTPLKLVFPKNITSSKLSSNSDNESNKNADKDNKNSLLSDNLTNPRKSTGPAGNQNTLPDGTPLNSNDYKIIDIKYSTGEYIPGVDYNYIYITKDVENLLAEADEFAKKETADDLRQAQEKLEAAKKLDPQNKLIDERLKDIKNKKGAFDYKVQPLLKFILGFVTLPIKIVAKIIQYIMDFFKSLTNPLTLPSKLVEFLSFKWILDYFIPPGPPLPGLLKLLGMSFDPTKLVEWVSLAAIPNPKKLLKNMSDKIAQANSSANGLIAGAPGGVGGGTTTGTDTSSTSNANANSLSDSLKESPPPPSSSSFPWPMPLPKGDHLIPDDFELADLSQFISMPFTAKLPTFTARQIRTSPKNPLQIFWPILCLIEKIINGIIDFFWSLLGIEAIIPPPHIKICKSIDPNTTTPEDLQKILNGEDPKGANANAGATPSIPSGQPKDSNTEAGSAFMYLITLPDGRQVEAKNDEELAKFIQENKDFGYDFQF